MNLRKIGLALLVFGLAALCSRAPVARADGPIAVTVASADDSSFPTVTAVVLIDQNGKPLTSIPEGATTAIEDGEMAQVVSLTPAASANIPLELVLTIDTSGSMAGGTLKQAQAEASGLLKNLRAGDTAALISFDNQVRVEQASTSNLETVGAAVTGLAAHGNTALYDAVAKSADVAGQAVNPRRAVVLLTDGEDYGGLSKLTREQSLARAVDSHTIFYVIGVGSEVDALYLRQLAEGSGGRYFQATQSSDLGAIYATIEERLRSYFVLTLHSAAPATGASRSLKVTVQLGASQTSASLSYSSRRPGASASQATPIATATPVPAATPATLPTATSSGGGSLLTIPVVAAVGALPVVALVLLVLSNRHRRAVPAPEREASIPAELPLAGAVVAGGNGAEPRFRLVASQGEVTRSFNIRGTLSIGSAPESDIVFSGEGVASHHARIWVRDEKVMLHHLADGYETRIAGQPIDWAQVDPGSEVTVGSGTLLVERRSPNVATSTSTSADTVGIGTDRART